MMGMMSMVRVLPDREYDDIQERIRKRATGTEQHAEHS
jgi:hypothetical protein